MQECGCNFSFSVPSLAMILGFFLGHDRLERQCEDEDRSPSTRIVPHPFLQASVHTATPPLPSAISLTMSWIIHLSEQQRTGWRQHPRVLVSPTLRAKETERQRHGGWGGERRGEERVGDERYPRWWGVEELSSPYSHWKPAHGRRHMLLSVLLQPSEGVGGGREGGKW